MWGIDFHQVSESFRRANYLTLPIFLALLFLFFWLKALRWRLLLQPLREFRTREVVPPLMIGFMGNNLLPAHLGELIRVFVLAREFSLSKTAVFSSVVLERVLDMAVIVSFLVISLMQVCELPAWVRAGSLSMGILTALMILFLAAYVLWTPSLIGVTRKMFRLFGSALAAKFTQALESGRLGLISMQNPRLFFGFF